MKMDRQAKIPRIPYTFFRWYCQYERYEELHGDLEELFHERAIESGPARAKLLYWWDVVRCCQPYAWKTTQGQTNSNIIMFKNYYKTSFRSLMKSPFSSFINVFGLSVAIGVAILVYGFSQWVNRMDQFHEHKNEVYLATAFVDRDGTLQQNGLTPRPLGAMLREDFAHIKKVCRVEDIPVVMKYSDHVFHEKVRFTDPEFLQMFTFPLKWGTPGSLDDLNSIILSEEMSVKYFGDENPVGRDILMVFGGNRSKAFKITGVAQAFPEAHAIDFDFLVNFKNVQVHDPSYDLYDWREDVNATLIQIQDPSDLQRMEQGMEKYKALQNEVVQDDWAIYSFAFEPLATLYENSAGIRHSISSPYYYSNHQARIILSSLGLCMLALACFNYINIAIVSAAKRLKEIGLRKVVGANRKMVIVQFLTENVIITLIALLVGALLAVSVIIPWFEYINDFNMGFYLIDPTLWIFLVAVLLLTGLLSGIYPAFYISKFHAVTIFKGSVRFGKKNPLTKVFLGVQLVLSCILIVCAVMFTQNNAYIANRSWGYSPGDVLYTTVPGYAEFEQLEAVMARDPNVMALSGSGHHLGRSHATTVVHLPAREYEVDQLRVDAHYFETMGLEIAKGRAFRDRSESDREAVIVNQVLVENMDLEQPLGQFFEIDSTRYEVIGVVNNFHSYSFYQKIRPTLFRLAHEDDYRYLSLKVRTGAGVETHQKLQEHWAGLFPEVPFEGGFQQDVWGGYFEEIKTHGRFWRVVAFIAIVLASLGLFGLVALNVAGRAREFSIRRVLGAELKSVAKNIIAPYAILFTVALLAGAPVSYLLVEFLFDAVYFYHIPMNVLGVVIAISTLMLVLLVIVFAQLGKIAAANPVDGLKVE